MLSLYSIYVLGSVVLALVLAIPSNTCIVIVNLETIRKKGKLSPSDVIFMAKGIVNILLQGFLTLSGMFSTLWPEVLHIGEVYAFVGSSINLLMYFNFWMTAWLSAHYCTSITNLSYGLFIWIKEILSTSLCQIVFLTGLGTLALCVPTVWTFQTTYDSDLQSYENRTESLITEATHYVSYFYLIPVSFLGCILPFCLSLLCLLLTFSFLVRHVWRVKNNDSGSPRPNLQAHLTALRTIFFLIFSFTSAFTSRVIIFMNGTIKTTETIIVLCWNLQMFCPSAEAAVIFQASIKLRRTILRRFWTRRWSNTGT